MYTQKFFARSVRFTLNMSINAAAKEPRKHSNILLQICFVYNKYLTEDEEIPQHFFDHLNVIDARNISVLQLLKDLDTRLCNG